MYRTIDAAFWTDPKVRELNPNGRFLLLYLITNPHTHVSGIYYLPPLIMQHETGLSVRVLDTLSATLDTLSLARFDHPKELVWVVNMFKFQGSGQKNTLSAAHHLNEDIHNSYLINAFCERYPDVKKFVKNRVSEFGTPDPRSLIPEQDPEQDIYPASPVLAFGEFKRCLLTEQQHEKLKAKLNGSLEHYINRFDRWLDESAGPDGKLPPKMAKRKAYNTILNWFDTDVKDGKIHGTHSRNGNADARKAGQVHGKSSPRTYVPKQ